MPVVVSTCVSFVYGKKAFEGLVGSDGGLLEMISLEVLAADG